ncbi:MAG: lipoyl synthase [Candidatus Eisenbacteria sp.]|nr:lipoyl synthase [Candidatus Eisenbacteria bacterium]
MKEHALTGRKPRWLRKKLPEAGSIRRMESLLRRGGLDTVCQSAQCPNRWECFAAGQATFLILGNQCTRRCVFCGIPKGNPGSVDRDLPERVAAAVAALELEYLVITSVTRDDLPDRGTGEFVRTIRAIRERCPGTGVEVLIPDFGGDPSLVERVVAAAPEVLGHNVETVERLFPVVRPGFRYHRSLEVLSIAKSLGQRLIKSGLMLGLGETDREIRQTLEDLRNVNCDIVTLGQYLNPCPDGYPVRNYVHPEQFDAYRQYAIMMGFKVVNSGPFVRSSSGAMHAEQEASLMASGT